MLTKIQEIVFPKEGISDEENLYYRKIGLPAPSEICRDKIIFRKNQRINFDTYYNSFSILKWMNFTNVNSNVSLKIKLKGKFNVELIHFWLRNNGVLEYETVSKNEVDSTSEKEYLFNYVTDNSFGMLSFKLEGLEDNGIFYGASYVSDIKGKPKYTKIAIGICTFKREEYVKRNIESIKKYVFDNPNSVIKDNLEIFISDNAGTLSEKDFVSTKNLHLVQNKNTGGSGGFTRCMIEAINYNKTAKEPITRLILMDDDIKFDPISLERVFVMSSLLRPEYEDAFIGGAMCRMDKQYLQHASGEFWHSERPECFVETFNNNRDLRDIVQILENENFTNANYQAWWFCAIPMMYIREDNLSLPLFIKSDDIEFSIRNLKHLILLNGINVWHESFESKYSAQNEYYTVRNYLVSAAAHHAPITKERILTMFKGYFKHYLSNYKYLEIEHFCNAINDFLGGVDHFKTIDLEAYHKSILKKGYKMVDVSQLPVKFSDEKYFHDISYDKHIGKISKLFRKYTINGLLLPSNGYAVLGMWGGSNVQTFRKKFLVRYEINTKKGFILTRNLKKAIHCYNIYKKTMKNINKNFDKAYADFENRWPELCTLNNWKRYL